MILSNSSQRPLGMETLERRQLLAAQIGPESLRFSDDNVWAATSEIQTAEKPDGVDARNVKSSVVSARDYRLFIMDLEALERQLFASRRVNLLSVPTPEGKFERFSVSAHAADGKVQIIEGVGFDDVTAKLRIEFSSGALQAEVNSADGGYVVEPYYRDGGRLYASASQTGDKVAGSAQAAATSQSENNFVLGLADEDLLPSHGSRQDFAVVVSGESEFENSTALDSHAALDSQAAFDPSAVAASLDLQAQELARLEESQFIQGNGGGLPLAPPLATSFDAVDFDSNGTNNGGTLSIPPDPIGAAGPNHLVNVVNRSIEFYQKDGTLDNSQSLQSFFSSPTGTFDPKVIYDQHAGRFVVVTLERQDAPSPSDESRIYVAVSDDANPNGTWRFTTIDSKTDIGGVDTWADYPGLGVDEDAVYITNNMFQFSSSGSTTFRGSRLWIIDKGIGTGGLYDGGAASITVHDPSTAAGLPGQAFTMQPAHILGTPPTGSTGTFLVSSGWVSGSLDALNVIRVDDPLGTPSFSDQFIDLGDVDVGGLPDAPQSGSAIPIETNDPRALHAVWRNNKLYTVNTVNPPTGTDAGQATAHWYQIDTTTLAALSLDDQGNIGGEDIATDTHTFFPSIAVDQNDNIGIGFSASASTIFPGAYFTGREPTDPAGTVQASGTLQAGLDFYVRTFGTAGVDRNRWGDYSGIAVDPADGETFWVYNEYAKSRGTIISGEDGRWATKWGSFNFSAAPPTEDFGDAPSAAQSGFAASYPVTVAEDGARHTATGPSLGAERDAEANGVHSLGANSDDTTGTPDDEDGVTLPATIIVDTGSVTTGSVTVNLQNADGGSNRLDAWIDWNRDGDWGDAGEQIFTNFNLGTTNGAQVLSFPIPQDTGANVTEGTSYARFRLSTAGGLGVLGAAADGEVEDYQVTISNGGGGGLPFRLLGGTGGDPPNPFSLVELGTNPSSEAPIGSTSFLSAMDVDPTTGTLYGASSTLRTVDPDTAAEVTIGSIDSTATTSILMKALSFSPSGQLYGVSNTGQILYEINKATAFATEVGSIAGNVFGIEFAPDGTLYGAFNQLVTIDPATAATISTIGTLPDFMIELDFGPDGVLRGLENDHDDVFEINVATGAGTIIGTYASHLFSISTLGTAANPGTPITGFNPVEPLGSLVYDPPVAGTIGAAGETDVYTIDLDAGQTITVTLTGMTTIQGNIEVFDSGAVSLGSASAGAVGDDVFVQTITASAAGTYEIHISDLPGTNTGDYTVEVILNAAVEDENLGGPTNDTIGTAQFLDGSLIGLPGQGLRGAVLGTAQSASDDFYVFQMSNGESLTLAAAGNVDLELLDNADVSRAVSVSGSDTTQIYNFQVTADGLYKVRVSSAADGEDYTMIFTVDSTFDAENNSSFDNAQDITGVGANLGYVRDVGVGGQFDTPLINQDGQGFSLVAPPDTVGDVGIDYYVQAINHTSGSAVTVYDKTDGSVVRSFILDTLAPSGPGTDGLGDPIVLFDHLDNRWFLAEFSGLANGLSVFVSKTSDPTDNPNDWHHYFFNTPNFPDYPKFGVWPDGYYASTNESGGPAVYVMDRGKMLTGDPTATIQRFTAPSLAGFGFQALTPADLDGPVPPAGEPGIFMRHRDDEVHNVGSNNPTQDFLEIWELDADFVTPGNSTFTKITDIATSEFDSDLCGLFAFECFPQPGTSTTLDPLREVIMWRLQYRNFGSHETLVGNLVTDVDGTDHGGVRWFELRDTGGGWGLHQEGTIAPDGDNRWMAGTAMDGAGNIAAGYNVSSSTTNAGLRYTGRLASDPLGTMPQGEHILVNGIGAQTGTTRWGDYSAMSVDPVDDATFWFTGEYADSGNWNTRIGAFQLAPPSDTDFVSFEALNGDLLTIETFTPFDGPGDPVNTLDPFIELFAPDGTSVASDDNSAADGRNAILLNIPATQTGAYRVQVSGTNLTDGEYVAVVSGNTGANLGPMVIGTNPVDGSTVPAFPTTYIVDFSEAIDLTTVSPADLVVGGLPSLSVTAVDGDTFSFTIDPAANIGDGVYSVSLAAGELRDLQGNDNLLFTGTFILDTTGPRVTSTLYNGAPLPADRVLQPGPFSFEANFNEALKVFFRGRGGLRTPTAEDIELINITTGEIFTALSVDSNLTLDQFTADFPALPEGEYELRLISGDDAFEDQAGNDLDGEPLGPGIDGTPSGNGAPGGDYTVFFFVDESAPVLNPFERLRPLGSLISDSIDNLGALHSGDFDDFTLFMEAGETLAATLTTFPGIDAQLEIVELGALALGIDEVYLPPVAIPADGVYTLRVSDPLGFVTASYSLDVLRNSALEFTDSSTAARLNIDNTFVPLSSGRFAVVGTADVPGGPLAFTQFNDPAKFVDISGTGTGLGLGDDSEATITTTIGNSIFPAGDVTVGNNGVIVSGAGANVDFTNKALPTSDFGRALLPFWDDLFGPSPGDVWWQDSVNIGGHNAFVVQWERAHFSAQSFTVTLQAQVFDSGPVPVRFAYQDVTFGNVSFDGGASATIGYQESTSSAIQFSMNTAVLTDGDVLELAAIPSGTDVDAYEIDLTGKVGQPIDILLSGLDGADFSGESLDLFAPGGGGGPIASAVPNPLGTDVTNYDLGLLDFIVPFDGVYTILVTSTDIAGDYSVVVTDPLSFDTEPNGSSGLDPLRNIDVTENALGWIDDVTDLSDSYEFTATAGETIRVATRTPFDSVPDPANLLDPEIVVTQIGAAFSVSDADSASDGKNADLTFVAPATGTYRVDVIATTGGGEYMLAVNPPPEVFNTVVNETDNQRSVVTKLEVQFDGEVIALDSAFSLIQRDGGAGIPVGDLQVNSAVVGGKTVTTITFGVDPNVIQRFGGTENSLKDGNYELIVDAAQVTSVAGGKTMENDYHFGTTEADSFFRFYGDEDGDRDTDTSDLPDFGLTFRKTAPDPDYNPIFDEIGDGDVDTSDLPIFGAHFRQGLPFI